MGLWGPFWAIFLYFDPLSRVTRFGGLQSSRERRPSTPTRGRPQRGAVGVRARGMGLTGPWWGSGLGSRCWAPGGVSRRSASW